MNNENLTPEQLLTFAKQLTKEHPQAAEDSIMFMINSAFERMEQNKSNYMVINAFVLPEGTELILKKK